MAAHRPLPVVRVPLPRPAAVRRLICFPHAGGSANFFRGWATDRPEVEVAAVQYPGRADRLDEPCHGDLAGAADEALAALGPLLDRPVVLLGHSLGAIVAYETARRLEHVGRRAERLVVSSARAPHDPGHAGGRVWDEEAAARSLIALGHTDAALLADQEARELVLPYLRADFEMLQRYRHPPGTPLRCDILAVRGDEDGHVTARAAERWGELTTGAFHHTVRPGGHFYLVPEPPIELFLDALPADGGWGGP
ncbi:thioesterase [Streptomyces sp. AJS327]|uniref:thioesterase II family protein n=1 Tax=Streptomyces sp. AJS327 TaxID=2545265 RepID=UPI0015DF2D6C|nr:alpha/beta fold hydrolase [Streptomyces sp. AJS327]MBA0051199.1 thioesterase [Streptomyces sp. AJS327]